MLTLSVISLITFSEAQLSICVAQLSKRLRTVEGKSQEWVKTGGSSETTLVLLMCGLCLLQATLRTPLTSLLWVSQFLCSSATSGRDRIISVWNLWDRLSVLFLKPSIGMIILNKKYIVIYIKLYITHTHTYIYGFQVI